MSADLLKQHLESVSHQIATRNNRDISGNLVAKKSKAAKKSHDKLKSEKAVNYIGTYLKIS
jgi:hypothetical protein